MLFTDIRFQTMEQLLSSCGLSKNPTAETELNKALSLHQNEALELVAKLTAVESPDIQIKMGEKGFLNGFNKKDKIRYPFKGKLKTVDQKIILLLQYASAICDLVLSDKYISFRIIFHNHSLDGQWNLKQDSDNISGTAQRILSVFVTLLADPTYMQPFVARASSSVAGKHPPSLASLPIPILALRTAILLRKCVMQGYAVPHLSRL